MVQWLNTSIILTGIAIFFARIADVSFGTLRTIAIVQGRSHAAFWLGFFEIGIWLSVISTVVYKIKDEPFLGIFYAFGFAAGNMVGIRIEKWLAFGHVILRVISRHKYSLLTDTIRNAGFRVTTFQGEGMTGPVVELYIVCRRKDLRYLLQTVQQIEPDAFYITEQVGSMSKIYRPILSPVTGWRSILKKK